MKAVALLGLFILMAGVLFGTQAFGEPLENVGMSVLDYDGNSATVGITWNYDDMVMNYKIGCVSCNPNIVEFTTNNSMTLGNVTSFPNGSLAMLYVITYDSQNEIISAKQLIVNLNE